MAYISALRKPTAWTLLFVGPKVRTFGFLHPKEDGLWEWERYDRVPVDAA